MIGTCSRCYKLYDFGSEEAAYEPNRLCLACDTLAAKLDAQRDLAPDKVDQKLIDYCAELAEQRNGQENGGAQWNS